MRCNRNSLIRLLIGLLPAIPLLSGALMIDLPRKWNNSFIGDSAVYYAMSDSIAHDSDLRYTHNDLLRITKEWSSGPQGVLLVAHDNGEIYYAKPVVFPLLSSPFTLLLKSNGILTFNTLCFISILLIGFYGFSYQDCCEWNAVVWTWIFWGLTVVPAYIFSLTPEIFNAFLIMLGLVPWLAYIRSQEKPKPIKLLLISMIILGISAANRPPNGLFILVPLGSLTNDMIPVLKNR
ncbi:hypothetical protein JW979_08905, partial [bacterium]|nr:hypothetical protein [candidate division CSSED10-310 bacterium]